MARENILLVVNQETNGWYRCMAGGWGGCVGEAWMGCGCRPLSRQVMQVSEKKAMEFSFLKFWVPSTFVLVVLGLTAL